MQLRLDLRISLDLRIVFVDHLLKTKKEQKNFRKPEIQYKTCFQHDMAYEDIKDLPRRAASDKVFNIDKNPKYNGYQRVLVSMVYKLFNKKSRISRRITQTTNHNHNYKKQYIRKFEKREVYSIFKDNILSADLADMQLISKFNKGFLFLLCVIEFYSNYAWAVPLKGKKCISITNTFQNILNES